MSLCGRSPENLRDVDDRMTRHRECKTCLPCLRPTEPDNHERAGIENRRHRRQPRLVVMIRTEETKQRVQEMTLHQFSGPTFPSTQELVEIFGTAACLVTAQQFCRTGGRAGSLVQPRNVYFTSREGLIQDRQVAND